MVKKFKQTEIGLIPEDWEIKTINETCYISLGGTPKTEVKEFWGGKVNWASARDVANCQSRYVVSTERTITELGVENSNAKIHPKNTIVITSRGTVGSIALLSKPMAFNQTCYGFQSKKEYDVMFIYYALKNSINRLKSVSYGTVFETITTKTFDEVQLQIPPFPEQHSIAKILSDLDSKIELLQSQNKTLEAIGQALFKHWFVDFEFPDEKGKPYRSNGGKMVDSELGKIPEGWMIGRLGDYISLERGLSYKGKGLAETGLPMINLGTVAPHKGFIYEGLKFYQGEYKERNLVKPEDLVIANTDITQKRDVLGSPAIVPSDLGTDEVLFTHHIYGVRNNSKLPNLLIYYLLQLKEYKDRVRGFATGTTVLALPEDAILDFMFVVPEDKILIKFIQMMKFIKDKMDNSILENRNLSQIRDSLLPKLMSGKIRVPVEVNK